MKTAERIFGPLTGGEHLRVGWLDKHEGLPREMTCGCELRVLLSQARQGCRPSQGGSSIGHTALSIPWQPGDGDDDG